MFNKSQLDAYNNIKAPHELLEKVVNAKPKKSKIYLLPLAVSLAACLILVFGVAAFSNNPSSAVLLDGQLLNSDTVITGEFNPVSPFDMRSLTSIKIPVKLKLNEKTHIAVSNGTLVLENGERVNSVTLKSDAAVFWEIEPVAELTKSTMTLEGFSGKQEVILTQYSDGSFTAKIN